MAAPTSLPLFIPCIPVIVLEPADSVMIPSVAVPVLVTETVPAESPTIINEPSAVSEGEPETVVSLFRVTLIPPPFVESAALSKS